MFLENDVQNKVQHEDFGLYTALFSWGYIFASLTDIGLNQYVTKKLASEPTKIKEVFANIFSLKLIMLFLYPALMVFIGWLVGYHSRELYFLGILCFAHALLQLLLFFRANFQANQHFMIDSTASVMDKFILIILVLVMLSTNTTMDLFIYTRLAAILISVVVFFFISAKLYDYIAPKLEGEKLSQLIKQSVPFALITILYSLNEKIDAIIIDYLSRYSTDIKKQADAGLYAASYRFLDAGMMYLWTILTIFFAKFAYHYNNTFEKQKLLNFGQVIASVPMLFLSAFIYFYGHILFFQQKNSTPEQIAIMTEVLQILFYSAAMHGLFAIYSTLLTSTGHEKQVSKMIVGSIVLNVLGNFIFIPIAGPIASAWVTFASSSFLSLSYLLYTHLKLEVKIPFEILIRLLLVFIFFIGTFYLLTLTTLPWYMVTMLAGACLLLYSYVAGLIHLMLSRE